MYYSREIDFYDSFFEGIYPSDSDEQECEEEDEDFGDLGD
jgi:hypothetical protein